ncbi:hypothetical protein ON010_g1010 [Phytophthora cinnamomi]|nr:hypothetical protein ON010_g1010 [Phytophthora cinnamomi]
MSTTLAPAAPAVVPHDELIWAVAGDVRKRGTGKTYVSRCLSGVSDDQERSEYGCDDKLHGFGLRACGGHELLHSYVHTYYSATPPVTEEAAQT